MVTEINTDKWVVVKEWCKKNRCTHKSCICKIGDICMDIRGIEGCVNHKNDVQ